MTINGRIKAFAALGNFLKQFASHKKNSNELNDLFYDAFEKLITTVNIYNPWFTEDNVRIAIGNVSEMLDEIALVDWTSNYISKLSEARNPQNVAVIMAGNIGMVGFHDM